jgi:trimeric autotransporter adhesin
LPTVAYGSLPESRDKCNSDQKSNVAVEYKPTPIHLLRSKTAICESEYDPVKNYSSCASPGSKRSSESLLENVSPKRLKVQELSTTVEAEYSGDKNVKQLGIANVDSNLLSRGNSLLQETKGEVLHSESSSFSNNTPQLSSMIDLKDDGAEKLNVISSKLKTALHPAGSINAKKCGHESVKNPEKSDICQVLDGFKSNNGRDCLSNDKKSSDIHDMHSSSKRSSSRSENSNADQILTKSCSTSSSRDKYSSGHSGHSKLATSNKPQPANGNECIDTNGKQLDNRSECSSGTKVKSSSHSRCSVSSDKPLVCRENQSTKSMPVNEEEQSSSRSKLAKNHSEHSSVSQKNCSGNSEHSHSEKSSAIHRKPSSGSKIVSSAHRELSDDNSKHSSGHSKHVSHSSNSKGNAAGSRQPTTKESGHKTSSAKYAEHSRGTSKNASRHYEHSSQKDKHTTDSNKYSSLGCEGSASQTDGFISADDPLRRLGLHHKQSDRSSLLPGSNKNVAANCAAERKMDTVVRKDDQESTKHVIRSISTVDLFGEDSDSDCDVRSQNKIRGSNQRQVPCKQTTPPTSSDDVNLLTEDPSSDSQDSAVETFEQCQQIYSEFSRQLKHTSVSRQVVFSYCTFSC